MTDRQGTAEGTASLTWSSGALIVGFAALPPVLLAAYRSSLDDDKALALLAPWLYFVQPLVLTFAAAAWLWRWRRCAGSLRTTMSRLWPGVLAAVLLTALVFWLVPPQMR
ncbi:MAG: hypothetical protein ABIP94_25180, partial [Planctomycetota bacterium]